MGEGMLSRVDALPAAVTRLTVAALTGDTTLTVEDASSFTVGTVDVDGTLVEVTGADGTTLDVVALTGGLDVDSPVVLLNADGEPVTKLWATVDVPDSDAESGVFPLLTGLEWALPERSYDPPIPVEFGIIDGEEVVWLPGQARLLDPVTVATPYCAGTITTDQSIPDGVWTTVTDWSVYFVDFYADLAYPGRLHPKQTGWYVVVFGARWPYNVTGRRAVKVVRHTYLGDDEGFIDNREAASTTAPMSAQTTHPFPIYEGDSISAQVFQSSGAGLDILANECNLSIIRVGTIA